jgi:hypothetical protein
MSTATIVARRLGLVRAGARGALALGIGASLAANVLAAQPTTIGRVIAAWPPVALLLTVELLSRVPVAPGWLSRLRVVSAGAIAGIAAWVSYWHMVAVALEYGEAAAAAHLLPLSVDGLVLVASVCLLELGRTPAPTGADTATGPVDDGTGAGPVVAASSEPAAVPDPAPEPATPANPKPPTGGARKARAGRSNGSKRELVERLSRRHPEWSPARIAAEAGCAERTVRRHLAAAVAASPEPVEPAVPAEPAAAPIDDPVPAGGLVLVSSNGRPDGDGAVQTASGAEGVAE